MEDKLISTEELKQELLRLGLFPVLVRNAMENLPEAVVRCGKCEHAEQYAYGLVCVCPHGGMTGTMVSETDFCSAGTRKEEENERQ